MFNRTIFIIFCFVFFNLRAFGAENSFGGPEPLSQNTDPITISGSRTLSVLTNAPTLSDMELNGAEIFWSDETQTPIKKISINGGTKTALVRKMGIPAGFEVRGQYIYWQDRNDGVAGTLKKTTLDGMTTQILDGGSNREEATADVLVDDAYVYWVTSVASPEKYFIEKVPIAGGASTRLATSQNAIVALTQDAENIYWLQEINSPNFSKYGIKKVPKAGGTPVLLYSTIFHGLLSRTIVVRGSWVYFVDYGVSSASIVRIPTTGGPATILATVGQIGGIAVDRSNVYWIDGSSMYKVPNRGGKVTQLATGLKGGIGLTVNSTTIFWADPPGYTEEVGSIWSLPKTGGTPIALVEGVAVQHIALTVDTIYWTEGSLTSLAVGNNGRIARAPLGGGQPKTVISGIPNKPLIAVDHNNVYMVNKFTVKKVSRNGGVVKFLYESFFPIEDVDTDGVNVYWVDAMFSVHKIPVNGAAAIATLSNTVGNDMERLSSIWEPSLALIRVSGGYVYWTDASKIWKVSTSGGPTAVVASNLGFVTDFVVKNGYVYYYENDTGEIKKVSANGGVTVELGSSHWGVRVALAVDNQNLYWIDPYGIVKVSINGEAFEYIYGTPPYSSANTANIALDSTNIYFSEDASTAIKKITPK